MPKNKYSSWIDDRLDWHPGDKRDAARITLREATPGDFAFLKEVMGIGADDVDAQAELLKYMQMNGYMVRVAVRNLRYPVGFVISKHGPEENTILRYWVGPRQTKLGFMEKLLAHAALELPELPTRIDVDKDDVAMQKVVEALGWHLDNLDDDTNTYLSEPWKPVRIEVTDPVQQIVEE